MTMKLGNVDTSGTLPYTTTLVGVLLSGWSGLIRHMPILRVAFHFFFFFAFSLTCPDLDDLYAKARVTVQECAFLLVLSISDYLSAAIIDYVENY